MTGLVAPFAEIEDMLTEATVGMLADVVVTPDGGEPFAGMLSLNDTDFFDGVRGCDWLLRYAAPAALQRGQNLTLAGSASAPAGVLRVAEKPRALHGGREFVAPLAKVLTVPANGEEEGG
ncbi:hypothetical protein [Thauera butanivorans]|uniref:hypothetical protein n=1 Tax=Thauera butanivorans TaxID=86174 RepID=UPI000838F86F|nr:hypothetical protein [Thauera butanivorans]